MANAMLKDRCRDGSPRTGKHALTFEEEDHTVDELLRRLYEDDRTRAFRAPVRNETYYRLVKRPISLYDIRRNNEKKKYSRPYIGLWKDLMLLKGNTDLFYGKGSEESRTIRIIAREAKKFLVARLKEDVCKQ